jgi:hypothetical protein
VLVVGVVPQLQGRPIQQAFFASLGVMYLGFFRGRKTETT